MSVPPFSLDKPRYDQSKWIGRTKHFFATTNPIYLFTSDAELKDSLDKLQRFKEGRLLPGTKDEDLWKARTMRDAVVHPDTQLPIPAAFRVCAFVPANIPICAGMLMTAPTTFNVLFWQWVNQSYNAGFNYCNRNAGSPLSNEGIAAAYAAATTVSCGIAYSMGRFVERSGSLTPAAAAAVRQTVPYLACAAANLFNLAAMRSGDLGPGVPVRDADGAELGRSPAAARRALAQAGLTRVVLPAPVLLLPPLVMRLLDARGALARAPRARPAVELAVIVACVWGALPCAIALFPQEASLPVESVEPEFRGRRTRDGKPVTHVYFNKGI